MKKIKLKFTTGELVGMAQLLTADIEYNYRNNIEYKLAAIVLLELYKRIHIKQLFVVKPNKQTTISISAPEAYALCIYLPLIQLPEIYSWHEALRFRVLNEIEPKLT
jgi:hypothetical protein